MKRIFLWVFLLPLWACSIQEVTDFPSEKIMIGPGPEDMVLDHSQDPPRFLVSCTRRRDGTPFGEIVAYTPSTGTRDTLARLGVPDSLFFQPHGIFLDTSTAPPLLYTISHEHDAGFHPVYAWRVYRDSLVFHDLVASDLLHSPNALTVGPEGELFVVNDAGKRGSVMEKIFSLNRADIVKLEKTGGSWSGKVVAENLGFPAGINRIGDTIYAGDAVNNVVHVYAISDQRLEPSGKIRGLKGNDNIRVTEGKIYLSGHVKPMKFIGHMKSPEKKSPVEVWEIDPVTRNVKSIYYTDGSEISAGSTAIPLEDNLFIGQIFDSYILKVKR